MIMPDWQKPHCGTSSAAQAFCTGCLPSADRPSIVTIFSLAPTLSAVRMQLRVGTPSMWTVQNRIVRCHSHTWSRQAELLAQHPQQRVPGSASYCRPCH